MQLYDAFAGIAWQFSEKAWRIVTARARGLGGLAGTIARPGFVCLTSRHTRPGLFYSLASGGGSVTIIRKSPDCLFSGAVSGTIEKRMICVSRPPDAGKTNMQRARNVILIGTFPCRL